jgi:hypothetical protein
VLDLEQIPTDKKFAGVIAHYERACRASRLHDSEAKRALSNYGSHGAQISGCVRDHFPPGVKNRLRYLARIVGQEMDDARSARPYRVRLSTVIRIGQLIAKRDGVGFYGPRPYWG